MIQLSSSQLQITLSLFLDQKKLIIFHNDEGMNLFNFWIVENDITVLSSNWNSIFYVQVDYWLFFYFVLLEIEIKTIFPFLTVDSNFEDLDIVVMKGKKISFFKRSLIISSYFDVCAKFGVWILKIVFCIQFGNNRMLSTNWTFWEDDIAQITSSHFAWVW